MFCRNCCQEIKNFSSPCPQCKSNPIGGSSYCQTCGHATKTEDVICSKCGAKLARIAEPARIVSGKSRQTTTLLAILPACCGLNGIHRFYLGKTLSGIAMLLTLGGLGIWTILDLVTILKGKMKDNEEKPLA